MGNILEVTFLYMNKKKNKTIVLMKEKLNKRISLIRIQQVFKLNKYQEGSQFRNLYIDGYD